MKVLVLGWEYPPAVAGGLGAACQGLTTALAERGHGVQLALPEACRPYAEELQGGVGPDPEPVYVSSTWDGAPSGRVGRATQFHPYATDESPVDSSSVGSPRSSLSTGWGAAGSRLYGADLVDSVRAFTKSALERLAHLDFDVIHAHDWMTYPAALQLRMAARKPAVLHVHSTSFDRGGSRMIGGQLGLERGTIASVERAGVRTADAVCAVSEYTRGVLLKHYGARSEAVHVVHNAMTSNGAPPRAPQGAKPGAPPTALFLGRLTRQKGVGFLLRAARLVLDTHPTARFLVAGDGEERARLIEAVAELGLAGRVFFLGSISDEAKLEAYRNADVFVLPSVSEPFGLTPLESLMEGTPVVLTSTSGVAEVLKSAPAVEPWDARAMADALIGIFDSRGQPSGRAETLVKRGQEELSELSWGRSAAALEAVLQGSVQAATSRATVFGMGGAR